MTMLRAIFKGDDGGGRVSLWVTDGTPASTTELVAPGGYTGGLFFNGSVDFNPDFTVLGARALFAGTDASGAVNAWVTDGTMGGTSELSVAGSYLGGLFHTDGIFPEFPDFTVLGSKALFAGFDVNNHLSLWITDGTSAGTSEVVVAGASPGGLNPSGFTILGTRALFSGLDAGGRSNLWVTDGTSSGTTEVVAAGISSGGLNPFGFSVLGSNAIFGGFDASNHSNLWVTDGTAAGTKELAVAGAYAGGLFFANVTDFTVLGSRAVFSGTDAAGHIGLWVTDATSAGTKELIPTGAFSGGLAPVDFTVLGARALFAGRDTSGIYNLWVTDGTSAGTTELTISGAYSGGLFAALPEFDGDPGFTVFGSKALFAGIDVSGHVDLWVSDGTSAGTSALAVAGAYSGGLLDHRDTPSLTPFAGQVIFNGETQAVTKPSG